MPVVEAGGVEVLHPIENREVTDSAIPCIPRIQAIPPVLARFGTVAALLSADYAHGQEEFSHRSAPPIARYCELSTR